MRHIAWAELGLARTSDLLCVTNPLQAEGSALVSAGRASAPVEALTTSQPHLEVLDLTDPSGPACPPSPLMASAAPHLAVKPQLSNRCVGSHTCAPTALGVTLWVACILSLAAGDVL